MAHGGESREDVERALAELGWEVRAGDDEAREIVGTLGKYHLMVSFDGGEPTSMIISRVTRGGEILSKRWAGVERLPSPRRVIQMLS